MNHPFLNVFININIKEIQEIFIFIFLAPQEEEKQYD